MTPEHATLVERLLDPSVTNPLCKEAAATITDLAERLERAERALKDLIDTLRNPYDGGEFEHGEVPALDRARAALDKTEPQP